jgi:hypothetical protein
MMAGETRIDRKDRRKLRDLAIELIAETSNINR